MAVTFKMWGKEKKMCLKLPRNAPFENPTCPKVVKETVALNILTDLR